MYTFDPIKVAFAQRSGLSFVCSLCVKYWQARDRGIPGDQCLAESGCGSPIAGDDFHEYEGPLTAFERWCFVCGDKSRFGVRARSCVRPGVRIFGVCMKHVALLSKLRSVDATRQPEAEVREVGGTTKTVEQIVGRPPKSLVRAIHDAEREFSKEEERKG